MDDVPTVTTLVRAAAKGDERAWNRIVERYLPLVFSVIRKFQLSAGDAQDVSQTVWLRLVEHLDDVRDPRALPGWITVITRNESLRLLKARGRLVDVDPTTSGQFDRRAEQSELDENLLRAERNQMLRDGLDELPPKQRELLLMLVADPPLSYQEISQRLDIPLGSIGPTRARYLQRLRSTTAMVSYFTENARSEHGGGS